LRSLIQTIIIMNAIQFIAYTPQQLEDVILQRLEELFKKQSQDAKPKQLEEYLTRKEVAQLFKVDLSTIHNWCKRGKLRPYGIGKRVYFLKSDVQNALVPLHLQPTP